MENKTVPVSLEENRDKVIIRTSIIGILTNILLAVFKAVIGILSNSIAVTLDAVNNLSDALSSIITVIGTKLAGKLPDRKHPLGYGRIEYISAMIVSGIVLYAGITSEVESVKKIIHPEKPDYSIISLVIIAVAIIVKIILGRYVKVKGEQVNSGSLVASGSDAMFDAILSGSVLVSAIIYMLSGILKPIRKDYVFQELVNPIYNRKDNQVTVSLAVKYLDQQTKATQVSQFDLVLEKVGNNWKIIK